MSHPNRNLSQHYKNPEKWIINIMLYWIEHPLNGAHKMIKYPKSSYFMSLYLGVPMCSFKKLFISIF